MIHLPRLMLAAPSSGSGKTMLTCGILQAFADRGLSPASFKCGPDYIDPMFHTKVIGTPSRNLDTFFTDRETTRHLFAKNAVAAGISVLEGVMGIYDGLGGVSPRASSYELAASTDTPVILVVNARGMSISAVPLIQGYLDYQKTAAEQIAAACAEGSASERPGGLPASKAATGASTTLETVAGGSVIRGVILNRTTKMTYLLLKEEIERQTGVRVFGYVPRLDDCVIESRHLGLVTPDEITDVRQTLRRLGSELEQCLDMEGILALAQEAPDYGEDELCPPAYARRYFAAPSARTPRIAVASDEAFCFYYQDNLELLEQLGAKLVYFSPLRDAHLPEHIGGLILGGGYPELYAGRLAENVSMKKEIRAALADGMPYLAECGGFMYLHEEMEDMESRSHAMCGVISGKAYRTPKLSRFGYITLGLAEKIADGQSEQAGREPDGRNGDDNLRTGGQLLALGQIIRGHEFHYFDSTNPGADYLAKKPTGKRQWTCIHGNEKSAAGYPHLYYWSNPAFAAAFVEQAAQYAAGESRKDRKYSQAEI